MCHALLARLGHRREDCQGEVLLDDDTQEEIAEGLGELANRDEALRQALRERSGLLSHQLRVCMVEGLARGNAEDPEIVAWVLS